VTSQREADTAVGGLTETAALYAYTGDSAHLGYELLAGRWFSGAGEAVVSPELLRLTGKSVGDTLTLTLDGKAVPVRIVGEAFTSHAEIHLDRASVSFVDSQEPTSDRPSPVTFQVGLAKGARPAQFLDSVAGGANAGLIASLTETDQIGMAELRIVVGTLTIALVLVAGLGIAHTVVLNTRERRRDLAIVKAVGMTPGQVVIMAVTSMAILGFIGGVLGLPGGVAAQRAVLGLIAEADKTRYPQSILDVYAPAAMAGLLLCGVLIAVLAALIPARKAARISTASALHSE
jgi:putative ABC transport system permease protein